ncbi:MAG: MopE-related protein [Pseudomonadota bacterium]|nr:MopE-related protein [Pseudomonadota bacterium]
MEDTSKPDEPPVEESAAMALNADGFPAGDDCDDEDGGVFPGAVEACDGVDDDCDGVTDPAESVDAGTWYSDAAPFMRLSPLVKRRRSGHEHASFRRRDRRRRQLAGRERGVRRRRRGLRPGGHIRRPPAAST